MSSWGKRLSSADLSAIVARGNVRVVHRETAADKTPGRKVVKLPPKPKGDYYALMLVEQLLDVGLPQPELEYKFAPGRKFRADIFYPRCQPPLIVEIKGAVHRTKTRYTRDIEREQVIFTLGFRLLQVTPIQVRNGRAAELVREALA